MPGKVNFDNTQTILENASFRAHPEAIVLVSHVFGFQRSLIELFGQCLVEYVVDEVELREKSVWETLTKVRNRSMKIDSEISTVKTDTFLAEVRKLLFYNENQRVLGALAVLIGDNPDMLLRRSPCSTVEIREYTSLSHSQLTRGLSDLRKIGFISQRGTEVSFRVIVPLFYQMPNMH